MTDEGSDGYVGLLSFVWSRSPFGYSTMLATTPAPTVRRPRDGEAQLLLHGDRNDQRDSMDTCRRHHHLGAFGNVTTPVTSVAGSRIAAGNW